MLGDDSSAATIGVLASSSVTKSGSTISGNVVKTVTIQTDPGYSSNPGHDGTGTVISINCQSTGRGNTPVFGAKPEPARKSAKPRSRRSD